jgi:ABC-type uncharacterized transport system substrate-binding protein
MGGAAAAWPLVARAQKPEMPVIGFLNSGSPIGRANFVAGFRRGLREQGFVEGQNVAIEYRWANNRYDRLPELATDLVSRQVSVIAAIGLAAPGLAAKAATSTIPIVFQTGSDPIKDGLVASMNRPGGNVTGTAIFVTGLESKRLGLLHEVAPRSAVIAVLVNPKSVATKGQLKDVEAAARSLRRRLHVINASTDAEIDSAFGTIIKEKPGGLLVTSDVFFNSQHKKIIELANRHLLPTIYSARFYALVGGLMSYGTNLTDGYRQTGVYVGRVLKGEKPADLPVLQSTKFEFVLNLKTAKALDLPIPSGILAIVDEVIE